MAYQDELLRALLGGPSPQNPLGEALGPQFQGGVPSIESRLGELRQLMTAEGPEPDYQRQPYSTGEIVSLIASALGDALTARTAAKTRQYWQPMYVPGTLGILEGRRAQGAQAATEKAKSRGERARQLAALEYQDLLAGRNRADVAEERRLTAREARLENERISDERQRSEFEFKKETARQLAADKAEAAKIRAQDKAESKSDLDKVRFRQVVDDLSAEGIDVSKFTPKDLPMAEKLLSDVRRRGMARKSITRSRSVTAKAKSIIDSYLSNREATTPEGFRMKDEYTPRSIEQMRDEVKNGLEADMADFDDEEFDKARADVEAYFDKKIVAEWSKGPRMR